MRVRDIGLSLLGSGMVYVAMAACSSGSPKLSGGGGSTGASGAGSGSDSGLADRLMDPVPSASADPVSGNRLKAQYVVGDDGSKEYVAGVWFDSQRNETCAFTAASDGMERCLPDGSTISAYSDSSCTMPLLAVPTGCSMPAYVLGADSSTCGQGATGTHVFAVGAAATPTSLYVKSNTSCFAAGPAATGFSYYAVGTEVPATSFVSATTHHD